MTYAKNSVILGGRKILFLKNRNNGGKRNGFIKICKPCYHPASGSGSRRRLFKRKRI
jgi:hypothetical protein